MKKSLGKIVAAIFLSAFVATTFVACGGKKAAIKNYVSACESGDVAKIAKATEELAKYQSELTPEEAMEVANAASKGAVKAGMQAAEDAGAAAGKAAADAMKGFGF